VKIVDLTALPAVSRMLEILRLRFALGVLLPAAVPGKPVAGTVNIKIGGAGYLWVSPYLSNYSGNPALARETLRRRFSVRHERPDLPQ
jgi:hypothetical protein